MLRKIRLVKLRFWQQGLLHAFVVWLGLTVSDMLSYLYRVQTWGNYLVYADGTPVTAWQRFVGHNVDQHVWLDILVCVFLVEANYQFVFRRRSFQLFLGSSLICGLACMVYFVSMHGSRNLLSFDPYPSGKLRIFQKL